MSLKIYNSLTRQKEVFQPIEAGKVRMYVCGPTVYSYIHIGNARPIIFFDVVRRYLKTLRYDVTYVVNFTDVDDKLIRKAEELGKTVPEVAETFINAYYADLEALGIEKADLHPRVTENMPEIIAFIEGLVEKGFAYESGGDVYFRTEKFKDYGKLSHQNLDELQFGIRIEVDERKESPRDFVLWKKAKPGEIAWDSPWGEGRPGWHIECSAMIRKYLGESIDIHGGGQDLQFPHHECEIAQSETLTEQPFVRYWMHNGYIHFNQEKMSKSLGNVVNVVDILKQMNPKQFRYFMLSTHYRNPLNFNEEVVQQAKGALERIHNCVSNLDYRLEHLDAEQDARHQRAEDQTFLERIALIEEKFHDKLQDDFNTPDAITCMFDLVSEANAYMQNAEAGLPVLKEIKRVFLLFNEVLGILAEQETELLDEEVDRLIQERIEARQNKNWARADEIRDLLTAQGILLEDTPQGVRWRRKE